MDHFTNSESDADPIPRAAMARATTWYDELPLDHHIEELLGALNAVGRLGLRAPPDAPA
jgi:hypothetical protein